MRGADTPVAVEQEEARKRAAAEAEADKAAAGQAEHPR
jgi:hypothetical protein